MDLHEQLKACLHGRICLVGVGNEDRGDDGAGVQLARRLAERWPTVEGQRPGGPGQTGENGAKPTIVMAGMAPEQILDPVAAASYDRVLFLDAVAFGGAPGAVVLLPAEEMAARFPQVSTHKLSLGLLAKLLETNGRTKAWLLGIQPDGLRFGSGLSPQVRTTVDLLAGLLQPLLAQPEPGVKR